MRRFIGILTLVITLGTEILTPMTYAMDVVDLGTSGQEDVFSATENQENVIVYVESDVEGSNAGEKTNEVTDSLENIGENSDELKLNSKEITGKGIYNGVIVSVTAPVESFPEGTKLRIRNVRQDRSILDKQDQLIEQVDDLNEDSTMVSFDIAFYDEENPDVELSPVEGKMVSVVFNYENNEEFKKVDSLESKEIVVYHLEENEGNTDEIKPEVIDKITSNEKMTSIGIEGNEVGIKVDEFSVYTITITSTTYVLTLDAGDGTLIDDGNGIVINADNTGEISLTSEGTVILPSADRSGYYLEGWYLAGEKVGDAGDEVSVTENMTLNANWETLSCEFSYSDYVYDEFTGVVINGFSGVVTDECLANFVLPNVIDGKPVFKIEDYAFSGAGLTGVLTIPNNVKELGLYSFYQNGFTELDLGNVITIGGHSFQNMKSLENDLIIPDSVKYINTDAFRDVVKTDRTIALYLGNSVEEIQGGAFEYVDKNAQSDKGVFSGELNLPDTLTTIGAEAFNGNRFSGKLVIPSGLTSIEGFTFSYNRFSEIDLGNVTSIGQYAFSRLFSLEKDLIIPETVEIIYHYAFTRVVKKGNYVELKLSSNLASIGTAAFESNDSNAGKFTGEITLPTGLTKIENQVFMNNLLGGSLVIPNGVKSIGNGSFQNNNFSSLTLPSSVTSIDINAFSYNQISGSLTLPSGLTSLGHSAFRGNRISGTLVIPNGINTVGEYTFERNMLMSVIMGDNTTTIGKHAFDCQILTGNCYYTTNEDYFTLKKLDLKNVQSVGLLSFGGNGLKGVFLPSSFDVMGDRSFAGLNNTRYITGYTLDVKDIDYEYGYVDPLIKLYRYTFVNEAGTVLGTGYYPEDIESDMSRLLQIDYYTEEKDATEYQEIDSLLNCGYGYETVFSPELPETGIATEDMLLTGTCERASFSITYDAESNGGLIVDGTGSYSTGELYQDTIYLNGSTSLQAYKTGYDFVGWTTDATGTGVISSYIVDGPVIFYAVFKKEASSYNVNFYNNGASLSLGDYSESTVVPEIHEGEYIRYTCGTPELWNTDIYTSCKVKIPTIVRDGFEIKGFSGNVGTLQPGGYTFFYEGDDFYAQTSKTITATFNANGNPGLLSGEEVFSSITKECSIENIAISCEITSPEIQTGTITPEVIGFSNGAMSYENVWTPGTTSSLTISNTYYAQTKAEHTFNVTYTKAESGIASIGADADSCDTVYYNEQTSSCSITLPSITLDEGYESAVWKKDGVSYTPGTELWISGDESFVADARLSSYTITFNTDGGSAVDAITQAYGTSIERPDDPSKEGYTFSGWDIEIPETMPAENLTITALWTINSHLFALNSADGIEIEAGATAPGDYYDYATEIVFTGVVLPGYTFLSWSGLPANASYSNSGLTVRFSMPDEDVIVTPILGENDYTVVFHKQADDALGEMEDLYLRYNERNYLPGNLFGRTGYNFLGWSRAENSDEIDYEDGAYINEAVLESGAIVDLYAVWTGIHYSILFDGNSDEAAGYTAPIYDVLYDDEVSLSENGYERNGYNFLGWSMNAGDSDPSYSDQQTVSGLTVEDESYITLYAIWGGRGFYVDFDKNAEDAVGEMETQRFIYGTSQSLRKNTFTRPGYTFLGWSEYAWDVEAEYEDEAEGSMLTTNENSTVDLYAVWHANEDTPYYVNYYLQNIEDDDYTLSGITIEKTGATDSIISVNDLVENYAGFDFLEARDSEGNIIEYTNLDGDESTVINLYYDRVVHSVSLATNRGTSNVSGEGNYRYGASVVVNVDVNDGYEWNAWRAGDASVVSNEKNYSFIMGEDDVSLEAYAQAIDYAISYVLRGGENNVDNPESYTVEDVVTLYNPSKEGYEFMGWTLSGVVMEPEIGYTFSYETGDKLFIAHWNAEDVGVRVEHYIQDLDEEEYTLVSGITESGIADDEIGDRTREWEGFEEADGEKTVILNGTGENNEYINPDGSTVIQYYYPRASYVLSLMEGQGVASVYGAGSYKYEEPVEISAVVRDGYSFVGFYSGEELHDEAFSMPAYPLSLDAVASANHYVVHFDGGDAALGVMEDQEFVYDIEDTLNENSYERVGYSFVGRRDKVNDAVYADGEAVKNLVTSGEITLSALWQVNSYSLTLYKNDGSDEYATEYFVYDETGSVITSYERNGYLFVGWNTDEYGAGEEKDVSSVYQRLSESGANLNLYAQREIIPYSIEYFGLEGIDEELNNPTYYDVESGVIVLENPSKNGYGFLGWSGTDIDGLSKNVIIPEQSTGNRIYEANFKENTYTLYLSAAGGVFENGEEWYEEEIEYLKPVTVPEPTRNGYEFAGWDIEIPESMPASDMYAVAEWNIIPYTIQYELHGGALADGEENPESYTVEDVVALYNPSKEGYTFIGWSGTDIDGVSDDVVVWTGSTGNRSYEANFKENTYTLYLSAAGGVFENGEEWYEEEIEYLQPVTVPEPTRNGYEFAGWDIEIPESMPASDVYAVAEWNIIPYTIQYELHGGALADGEENPEEYDVESGRIVLYNPKKEGYTFIGWSGTDIDGVSDAVVVWAGSTGNRSYEANWNENSYIIRLHENNGSEEYYDREVLYTEEYIVPQNGFEKVGYSFSGWNARSGGDAEWYEIGTIISGMRTENAEVFDLYAIWDINQYTLSFDTDGGTEIEDITQDYDTEITAPENPSKTGYTFAGWDIPMPLRMPAEDLKLTAQWEVNVLAIVFDTDGGTPISTITGDYGTVVTRPDDPIKTGYTFNGWIPEIPETIPEEMVTVKAQWSANTYEVVFDANGGEGEMENQAFVYDEGSKTLTENVFSRLGYEFVGWNTEGDGSGTGYHDKQEVQNLTAVSGAVVTLYAQWSVVPYSIIYHLAGGTGEVAGVYSVETETFELPTVEKTGYTFMGWTGTDLDGVVRNVVIEKGSVGNREYTAQWEANIYIVEFRNDEESAHQMFIYDEEQALDVNSFVKTGYSFSGWISGIRRFDDGEVVKNLTIGSGDTVVLHAEWNANTYIVSFDGNGGSGSMGDQEFVYDVAQKLRENAFELSGYAFSGWIDENEMRYGNNEEVKNLATGGTVVLSAEWNKLYQLVIKDGETVLFSGMLIAGEKIVLPVVPTKTGYKFVRWVGLPADGLMSDGDLVITIEWEKTSSDESGSSARAGGGGGRRIVVDSGVNEEHSSAELTGNDNILTGGMKEEREVLNAYEWAYHYGITTIGSEEAANANGFVKRGHLAKMLVNYVVNVLGKEVPSIPEECQTWNDDASEWESDEIRRYAEQACALGIMGIDTFEHKFYPNQLVSRAQFGTTLSRILYGDTYQGGAPYYERHLRALQEEGVMMEIDHAEERLEYRKWIWVMLRRTKEREEDEENEGSE